MDVDALYDAEPELFAYKLPTLAERKRIASGDLVKLFFKFEEFKYAKPIWMRVVSMNESDDSYTGVLADMKYGPTVVSHFAEPVQFDVSHLYRVPLDRPEIENTDFNDETRS